MNTTTIDCTGSNRCPTPVPLDGSPAKRPLRSALLITLILGSLSMLTAFPGTASAQSIPELNTCFPRTGDMTNGYTYTNNCSHDIGIVGYLHGTPGGARTCVQVDNESITAGSTYRIDTSHLGGTVCFQYHDARTHYRSGYRSCDSVLGDVNDCGTGADLTVRSGASLPDGSIVLSSNTASLIEAGNAFPLRISLSLDNTDEPPVSNIALNLTSDNPDVVISPASLTFSTTNYGTIQNVSITASDDADGANESGTITITPATTSGLHLDAATVTLSITDDDDPLPSATINAGNVSLDEGSTATMAVSLLFADSQATIASDVVIDLTSSNPDVTLSPTQLTFTNANKNIAQPVTVSAAEDNDMTDDTATITLTPTSTSGADVSAITATATVTDNDTPLGNIQVSPAGTLSIGEGASGSLSVDLSAAPKANVTVALAKTNTDVSLTPSSLTFTTANWNTAQTVTVSAAHDGDYADETDTITLSATGGIDASSVAKAVTITDDDTPSGTINVTPADALTIVEGTSGSLSVSLSAAPKANVTVALAKTNTDVSLSPSSLTFTTANWNTAQTVTVSAAHDGDYADETDTITLSATGGIDASSVAKAVTITDDDTPSGTINVTPADALTIVEGTSGSLSVDLSAAPKANVTVALAKTNTDVSLSPSSLTFTTANWNTAQTVTVSAAHDGDYADETDTITLSATGGIDASSVAKAVTITDDDTPSGTINVTPADALTIVEGTSGSLSVSLSAAPKANVTVALAKANADVSLTPTSLTFTTANWNTAQTVTVAAAEDSGYMDETDTITFSASGGIIAPNVTKAVTITDTTNNTPTFGDQIQADLSLAEGMAIAPVTLPAASGGDGALQYRISPSLPAGLNFNAVTREISGTPVTLGTTSHTLIASDSDNDTSASDQASLGFNIGIRADKGSPTHQATQAWLSRFGRGVGEQAIQGIRQRINSNQNNQPAQLQTRLGGHSIDASQPLSSTAAGLLKQLDQLDRSNLLHGSRFSASGKSGAGQIGIWGQGAYSDFAGEDNNIALDGKLRSLLLGSDYRRDNWAAGILLSRSNAEGDYRGEAITGELESDLTGVVPWGSIQMSEELSVWGAIGQGRGELQLKPVNESEIKTDLDWQMLAGGMQSRLIKAGERNRMGLSFTGDLLWTETTTDRVAMLQAVAGETRRVRLGLEADWRSRGGLTPRLELGIRHDSGDAETGLGVELGGGLTWRDGQGNRFEVNGRGLLTHNDSDSRDWGLSIVAQHDARPSSHRGFSMRLSHELGGHASGGVARLLSEDLLSADNTAADYRWELEMAYGIARARGLTGSGYTALSGGAGSGLGWRVGYRLQPEHTPAFEVDLHALEVREAHETDPGVGLNFIWR